MATETKTQWAIEADYIQACNCDYGCPCEFEAPPTYGSCDGLLAWRINKGNYGDVSLDGLGFAAAAHSPEALHKGNLTLVAFIDEKANEQQREALLNIASGKDGGMPFEILAQLVTTMLDPQFVPFQFNVNGQNSSVKVGDVFAISTEPIKNPVTGEPESVRIEHETGFIFKGADVVSAKEARVSVPGLDFSYPNKSGFVTQISYSN